MQILEDKKQKGFTLIELLIYIAITGVVIGSLGSYFFNLMKTYEIAKNHILIANNQSLLFEKIHFDLRYAEDIDDINSVFGDENGVLVVIKGSNSYSYHLEDGKILKSINSAAAVPITSNDIIVTSFFLQKIDTLQGREGLNLSVDMYSGNQSSNMTSKNIQGDIFVRERIFNY